MRFAWLLLALLIVPATASTVTTNFMPALVVDDLGAGHAVNNYTLTLSDTINNGTWVLLGTNDEQVFALLDSRKDQPFTTGVLNQFNISNTANYRYYYLYLVSGFRTGDTLEIHLDQNTTAPMEPLYSTTQYLNWTQKRSPLVDVFNLTNQSGYPVVGNYSVQSTVVTTASWMLFATNNPGLVNSMDTSGLTLIDTRSGVALQAGIARNFSLSKSVSYQYYVLYVSSGFETGSVVDIKFTPGAGGVISYVFLNTGAYGQETDQPVDMGAAIAIPLVIAVLVYRAKKKGAIRAS